MSRKRQRVAELTITDIGGRGHGIARLDGTPVYVPFTTPGDRIRASLKPRRDGGFFGELVDCVAPGPDRASPACPHFAACGGCSLQHITDEAYAALKLRSLQTGLARQGLEVSAFEALVRTPPGGRRRARFAAVGRRGGLVLGFNAAASHTVVDLQECPVITPRLAGLLPPLRRLVSPIVAPGQRLDVEALDLDRAVDLGFIAPVEPDLAAREALARFAEAEDIARIVWRRSDSEEPQPIVQRRPVRAIFGGIAVDLPPGAFLQASAIGEAALVEFVRQRATGRVVELFAGAGTFTLPLAATGRHVAAIEGNAAMAAALSAVARRSELVDRLRVERRDLVRQPLRADELAGADCVLLDPPRAGAAEQIGAIAQSRVGRAVYVSCNPVSFARDARRLSEAGFRLDRILPVDQFLWSPHLELAAVLQRESPRPISRA